MKAIIREIVLMGSAVIVFSTTLKAQELPVLPIEERVPWGQGKMHTNIEYAYFKDINHLLDPMVGHWCAEEGDYLYDFWITKKENVKIPRGKTDKLIIQYEVYEKGKKVLFSTFPLTLENDPYIPVGNQYDPKKKEYFVFYFGEGEGQEGFWALSWGEKPNILVLKYKDHPVLAGFDPDKPQLFPLYPVYLELHKISEKVDVAEQQIQIENLNDYVLDYLKRLLQLSRMIPKANRTFTIGDLTTKVLFKKAINKTEPEIENQKGDYYGIRIVQGWYSTPIASIEIEFKKRVTMRDEVEVPTYVQGLCHALLIEKIQERIKEKTMGSKFLKGEDKEDFGLLLDYYAKLTNQNTLSLARQYVKEMTQVVTLQSEESGTPEQVSAILWWGIRNSSAWTDLPPSERENIEKVLSFYGFNSLNIKG